MACTIQKQLSEFQLSLYFLEGKYVTHFIGKSMKLFKILKMCLEPKFHICRRIYCSDNTEFKMVWLIHSINTSVQFTCSVMSNSLWPTRLSCPSPIPGTCSNSCPSSQWCHPTISSSATRFSSAFNLSQHQGLFHMNSIWICILENTYNAQCIYKNI